MSNDKPSIRYQRQNVKDPIERSIKRPTEKLPIKLSDNVHVVNEPEKLLLVKKSSTTEIPSSMLQRSKSAVAYDSVKPMTNERTYVCHMI